MERTPVHLGIPEDAVEEIVAGLSRLLADTYSTYLKTHSYHWNVVGPWFHSLHAMFMEQYTELALAVDDIAERIRALGAPAPGTYREFAALTAVVEDVDVPDARDMVARLVEAHETIARTARSVLPVVEAAPDQVSADLLTRRLEVSERTAWMLRSLLG